MPPFGCDHNPPFKPSKYLNSNVKNQECAKISVRVMEPSCNMRFPKLHIASRDYCAGYLRELRMKNIPIYRAIDCKSCVFLLVIL